MVEPSCAFCRTNPVDPRFRPFCSRRCQLLDLAKWARGDYRIPGEPVKEPDDEADRDEE